MDAQELLRIIYLQGQIENQVFDEPLILNFEGIPLDDVEYIVFKDCTFNNTFNLNNLNFPEGKIQIENCSFSINKKFYWYKIKTVELNFINSSMFNLRIDDSDIEDL